MGGGGSGGAAVRAVVGGGGGGPEGGGGGGGGSEAGAEAEAGRRRVGSGGAEEAAEETEFPGGVGGAVSPYIHPVHGVHCPRSHPTPGPVPSDHNPGHSRPAARTGTGRARSE